MIPRTPPTIIPISLPEIGPLDPSVDPVPEALEAGVGLARDPDDAVEVLNGDDNVDPGVGGSRINLVSRVRYDPGVTYKESPSCRHLVQ